MYVQAQSTKSHQPFAARYQSGKAGKTLLTQTLYSSAGGDPAFQSNLAKYSRLGRYHVVACLCRQVEWYIIGLGFRISFPGDNSLLRCFRVLGLRGYTEKNWFQYGGWYIIKACLLHQKNLFQYLSQQVEGAGQVN